MGIRMLNKFLQSKCRKYITPINLSELSGKKIVVDISIYLYKFLSENALLENLYLMISIFRENKIIPIFIFDGKPPVEKNDTIAFRKRIKKNAREEYYRIKQILDDIESNTESLFDLCIEFLSKIIIEVSVVSKRFSSNKTFENSAFLNLR